MRGRRGHERGRWSRRRRRAMVSVTSELSEDDWLSSGTFEKTRGPRRYGRWDHPPPDRHCRLRLPYWISLPNLRPTFVTTCTGERTSTSCAEEAKPFPLTIK